MEQEGRCRVCGAPAIVTGLCLQHYVCTLERMRRRTGSRPWRPGSRGRPPKNLDAFLLAEKVQATLKEYEEGKGGNTEDV